MKYETAKPARVASSDRSPPPKKTRDRTVAKYRYSVKSYHSTIVDRAAIVRDPREIAVAGVGLLAAAGMSGKRDRGHVPWNDIGMAGSWKRRTCLASA